MSCATGMLRQRVGLFGDSGPFELPRGTELGEVAGVSTSAVPSSQMSCTPPVLGGGSQLMNLL